MTRGSAISFAALSLAALLVLPLAPLGEAAPPAPPTETFAESVDVSVVNVEVYVTDRDGKRVQGLKREDFELSEDGKPVAVSNFYAVDNAAAEPPVAAEASGWAPAGGTGNVIAPAEPPVPDEQHLYLALFVDQQSLTAPARNRMLPALKKFVDARLRPGDRVLVASYNGAIKVLQAPTADPAAIDAALGALAKISARGTDLVIDRRRVLDDINQAASAGRFASSEASRTYSAVRVLAQAGYDRVHATVGALAQFVDSLAGLPGRKAVLLLSGGMSQRPAEILFETWQNKFGRFSGEVGASRFDPFRQQTGGLFEALVQHANANRVTFYTLAVPEELSGITADIAEPLAPGLAATESINETQPLQILAGATGGLAGIDKGGSFLDRLRAAKGDA